MTSRLWMVLAGSVLALAGCTGAVPTSEPGVLPEEVLALVARGQDTSTARLQPDGCYWYLHNGPVETTYIPLVTRDGRMICVS